MRSIVRPGKLGRKVGNKVWATCAVRSERSRGQLRGRTGFMASGSMYGARFVDWETGRRSELRGFGKPKREGARRKGNFVERAVAEPTRRLGNQASGACTRRTQHPGNRGLRV
jgi:hypothetical protein